MDLTSRQIQEIYRQTVIIRRPTYGIVTGYHQLPYICLGASFDQNKLTTEVRGKVEVSPRFVIRPPHLEPSYAEIFGEENVDVALTGRIFGFVGFRDRPIECKSEHIEVANLQIQIDDALSKTLDRLDRNEDVTTGVVITPDARYFPVSVERFIASVLDEEFGG